MSAVASTCRRMAGRAYRSMRNLFRNTLRMKEDSDRAQAGLISATRPVVFDVGANIGMSVRRYLNIFPNAAVYSFEPFPESLRHSRPQRQASPTSV